MKRTSASTNLEKQSNKKRTSKLAVSSVKHSPEQEQQENSQTSIDATNDRDVDICCICCDTLQGLKSIVLTLPCKHSFHETCMHQLRQSNRKPVCPLCRSAIPAVPDGQQTSASSTSLVDTTTLVSAETATNGIERPVNNAQVDSTLPQWSKRICEKLPSHPYVLSDDRFTASVSINPNSQACGMWVLTASTPFEGFGKYRFAVSFTPAVCYMIASIVTEREKKLITKKDFGSDFSRYLYLEKTPFGSEKMLFDIDMARRQCVITLDSGSITLENLPPRVWLACSIKTGRECACTISHYINP